MKKILLVVVVLFNVFISTAWADSFVVQKIEIDGLQRISQDTVYSYLPVKRGDTVGAGKTGEIITALYKTGFFEHISLGRNGNTLVINVVERPTIGVLKISGNSYIPTDKLTGVMKSMDIAEGRVYNRAMIDRIKQSLLNQYYELGRYNATVDVTTTPMERNRMMVKIDISEGLVAKISRINIIGNHAFSEKKLDEQLSITTPGLLTFFTQKDRYSQEKLDESLQNLRKFYQDHGYLKFAVTSTQVAITPDRKSIYLTIVIEEGDQYTVSGVDVSGDLIISHDEMMKLIDIKPGSTFSRQAVMDAQKRISETLGDKGYIFTATSLRPTIDDNKKTVFLLFEVKPGKRSYVRHIYFSDNTKTNDIVLRREMRQMESSVVSTTHLEASKHRLKLLPYVREVEMTVIPVQDSDDQVDINYKVAEDNAASANLSVGYSQAQGVILGGGVNQKNFLGTGKTLGLNLTRSKVEQFYGVNYTDPYYTVDGISRSLNLSVSKFTPSNANITRSYKSTQLDASVLYSIPVFHEKHAFSSVQLGYGYEDTLAKLTHGASTQILDFAKKHGSHFQQADLIAGFSRDSRDKNIFPTKGMLHTVGLNLYLPIQGALTYYTAAYNGKGYQPLGKGFIAIAKGQLAYGSATDGAVNFPFFKNFYAGGIDSVHGFTTNTLGPRDSYGYSTGGNALATGSLGLILPNFVSENMRTTLFADAGNVWNTFNNRPFGGYASGPLRYSAGIQVDYLTPLGMVDVSVAKPINRMHGRGGPSDEVDTFQFSLGANFG